MEAPVALGYFAIRRQDLAYPWVFYLFSAFILLCGGNKRTQRRDIARAKMLAAELEIE